MNKIYRNVWNAVSGWVAASEVSKSNGKTGSAVLATVVCAVTLALAGANPAHASATCGDGTSPIAGACLVEYNPIDHDGMAGAVVVDGAGQSVVLRGSADNIALGDSGLLYPTLGELIPALNGQEKLSFGAQTLGVTTPDPITGGSRTVAAYDSAQFQSVDWGAGRAEQYKNVGDGQYIGSTMLSAQNGGKGVFDVGDKTQATSSKVNAVAMAAKNSKIAVAQGADSSVEWASRNQVIFVAGHLPSDAGAAKVDVTVPAYAGSFAGFDGRTYTVTNVAELAAYNDALVAALRAGRLGSQADYDAAFKQAVTFQQSRYTYDQTIQGGDELTVPKGESYSMYVDGAGARGKVLSGGQIDQRAVSIGVVNGGSFEVERGGSVSSSGSVALKIQSGSVATNNGVISGGYYAENGWDTTGDGNFNGMYAEAMLVNAVDAGSRFTNNGIMNVAGWNLSTNAFDQYAILLKDGAEATNNGIINIGVTNSATNGTVNGVIAQGNTKFTNTADGHMYVGRAAQYNVDAPEAVRDTENTVGSAAILLSGSARAENAGRITIGKLTQNSAAFLVRRATAVDALNTGVIDIYGHSQSIPLINAGMYAIDSDASSVVNGGTINLFGVNGVGVKAASTGRSSARVQTTGVINVAGAVDRTTGLRNYGAWAEGRNAVVDVMGAVNVTGDGAIGVHARDGGGVNISGNGAVNLSDGKGQIGFFAYGAGSVITNAGTAALQDVTTQGSTLFRMEDGADFRGGVGTSSDLTASGVDSTAVLVTGADGDDVSAFNSGAITVHLTGRNATGVRVEGGAQGKIVNPTIIDLAAVGAVAGIADGQKHGLDGEAEGNRIAGAVSDARQDAGTAGFGTGTILVSQAVLASTMGSVTGYIARSGAEVVNTGSIDFGGLDSTGIRIEADSRGTNAGSIAVRTGGTGIAVVSGRLDNSGSVTADGTAVHVEGAGSAVTNTGRILATDGRAAVELGNGASLDLTGSGLGTIEGQGTAHGVLVGAGATGLNIEGAHIVVNATGATGHGVENAAEINGLRLKDTIIDVADGIGLRTGASIGNDNSGTINVAGSGTGIAFQNADGSRSANALDLSASQGLTVTVAGAGGRGIVANTTGLVDTAVNVDVTHAAGGSALVLGDGATEAINRGSLTSISTMTPTVDAGEVARFTNAAGGVIAASATGDALTLADTDSAFTNQGTVTGGVKLGEGANTALLDNGSTLNGALQGGTGDDLVTVKGNASFGEIDGVSGNDKLIFDGARYTYDDSNSIRHVDTVQLSNNSTVTLRRALVAADDGTDGNAIVIDGGSTLAVAADTGAFTLNNPLQGGGMVTTSSGGQSFDFGAVHADRTGTDFSGTLSLGDSTFALKDQNTIALRNATLRAGAGSVTTVGNGQQRIKGLDIEGGTLRFTADIPDQTIASTTIAVDALDASHVGTVQVSLPQTYTVSPKDMPDSVNLLEQDDGNIGTKLVSAGSTIGFGGNLTLQDQNGNALGAGRSVDIGQGGAVVARGTYDYRLTTAPGDGLYVNWGLTQLDVPQGQSLTFSQDTDATGAAADMSARITGLGSLVVDAGSGVVSLSNRGNDYVGETTVASGTLRLDADNALGQTRRLNIASAATADVNGKAQTIGALNGQGGSMLDVNGGALTIANGGTSAGKLKGAGHLDVAGGVLDVQGANGGLSTSTSIASGAQVRMNDVAGLGSGAIRDEGILTLDGAQGALVNAVSGRGALAARDGTDVGLTGNNQAFVGQVEIDSSSTVRVREAMHLGSASVVDDGTLMVSNATNWMLHNAVSGAGDLVKNGSGALNVGDSVHHSGITRIDGGTLIVGDASHPYRVLGAADAGEVTVAQGATLSGTGTVSGHVTNEGVVSALNALQAQQVPLLMADASSKPQAANATVPNSTLTLDHGLTNRGLVLLAGPQGSTPGNVLHVKGGYLGEGGRLKIRTFMGDDASATDRLVIDGGRASGHTAVIVQSAGGNGAQTGQGIRVIETLNGGTTAVDAFSLDASSTGYRQGVGTLAVGAYDYSLVRGGNGGQIEDWYLTSASNTSDKGDGAGKGAGTTDGTGVSAAPSYRPEVGAYMANRAAAMQMTVHTLHERQGQAPGVDRDGQLPGKGAASDGNGWLRVGGVNGRRDGTDPMSTVDGSAYLLHGGSDLTRFGDGGNGSFRVGAMGMYGHTSSTYANERGAARGQVEGYSLGVYGTWYGQQDILSGPYVDAWVMGGRYRNSIQGRGLAKESYNATGLTASIEAGYSFKVHEDARSQVFVEPQVQVIVSNYDAGNHVEQTGTVISGMNDTQVTTRLGIRAHGNTQDDAGARQMRPFAELNWWHGKADATMRFNGDVVGDQLPSDRIEAKVGLQGNLSKHVSAWGALGGEVGGHGYRAGKIQAGLKYSW